MAAPDTLTALLDRQHVTYRMESPESMEAWGNMTYSDEDRCVLPKSLVVHGSLNITRQHAFKMPTSVQVDENLDLHGMAFSHFPRGVQADGDISLSRSNISSLPDEFCVHGALSLFRTPVNGLPQGLVVRNYLDLRFSEVVRFPRDMVVGGLILPPRGLLDAEAYLAAKGTETATLSLDGSRHHHMQVQHDLESFPDLWAVMRSLRPAMRVSMYHSPGGFVCCIDGHEG